jgi:hypothetical protein
MAVVPYSDIQTNIAEVFDMAMKEPVLIKRQDGLCFTLSSVNAGSTLKSPFEQSAGVDTTVTMDDILEALHDRNDDMI